MRIDPLNQAAQPERVGCAYVTFNPGADCLAQPSAESNLGYYGRLWPAVKMEATNRGNSSGRCGLDCSRRKILAWSRAEHRTMTHIAIQEDLDGKAAEWQEHASDEQNQTGDEL